MHATPGSHSSNVSAAEYPALAGSYQLSGHQGAPVPPTPLQNVPILLPSAREIFPFKLTSLVSNHRMWRHATGMISKLLHHRLRAAEKRGKCVGVISCQHCDRYRSLHGRCAGAAEIWGWRCLPTNAKSGFTNASSGAPSACYFKQSP